MVDESLNDYLQIGIIRYFSEKCKSQDEVQKALDSLGFRVGYSLIEKYFLVNN